MLAGLRWNADSESWIRGCLRRGQQHRDLVDAVPWVAELARPVVPRAWPSGVAQIDSVIIAWVGRWFGRPGTATDWRSRDLSYRNDEVRVAVNR